MDPRLKPWALVVSALGLAVGVASSCGGSDDQTTPVGGGAAGASTQGGGGVGGAPVAVCDPACVAPQFCSSTQVCLDPGQCSGDPDCTEPGFTCDEARGLCVPGGDCGGAEITVQPVAPNLLVVLDRSCSMHELVQGTAKWQIAVTAVNKLTTDYVGQIRFGLTLFPDIVTPDCQQGAIPIPVAVGNEDEIQTLLTASLATNDQYYPDGPCVTNIDTAMQQASTEPSFADPDRGSYALLITDGQQANCSAAGGDAGTRQIITDLLANKSVPTFVVGFGGQVDPAQLNIFAEAGGMPTGDPQTKYYKAEDQASLDAALQAIASATISCVVQLESVPEDPNQLYVFFNKDPAGVPNDPDNGWSYDPDTNQITFNGTACQSLKDGTVTDVDVVYGCNHPPT
jgi:hypothetical protein